MTHSEVDGLPPDLGPEHFRTDLCQTPAEGWRPPIRGGVDIAMLQYTSGSTRQPRGVILTHANLLHNLGMLAEFHRHQTDMVMVHWLPLFHDMGLIRGMLSPLHMGGSCFMLDPMEFAQKPIRWLKALSRFSATVTGAPDFGYALTAHKVPAHQLEGLDLSSLKVAFCSAEPIRNASLQRFANLLASVGLSRQALKPAYGLAEATVMVSGEMGEQFRTRAVSRHALGQGRVAPPKDRTDSLDMVNCGAPLGQQQLLIVDSEGRPCPFEVVGEVWIRGGSVSPGYWNNESDTAATFGAYLASGVGPYLRTGDLGWLESDGSLTVCGRLKDLLIIRGQNFYPHDIEAAVEGAVPELRAGCSAAFATEQEDPVVVCEAVEPSDALAYAVWAAAGQEFGLSLREVVILPPGSLPKTASGKVQRGLIRDRHAKGELGASLHWKAPVRPR
jgi:acyl-CoA synthetase (AMP-forming)/AMP-acid ligase II